MLQEILLKAGEDNQDHTIIFFSGHARRARPMNGMTETGAFTTHRRVTPSTQTSEVLINTHPDLMQSMSMHLEITNLAMKKVQCETITMTTCLVLTQDMPTVAMWDAVVRLLKCIGTLKMSVGNHGH